MLSEVTYKAVILDWHHLQQKCLELSSRICRDRDAKQRLLRRLYRRRYRGRLPAIRHPSTGHYLISNDPVLLAQLRAEIQHNRHA